MNSNIHKFLNQNFINIVAKIVAIFLIINYNNFVKRKKNEDSQWKSE